MNALTRNESHTAAADAEATYWQRITMVLDQKVAALGNGMAHYMREDLSERLPRPQPLSYRSGTRCDGESAMAAHAKLETRLGTAMEGNPQPQDEQLYQRGRAPLYAAFLRAEYPQGKQQVVVAFKRQMVEAAKAYSAYTQRMAENSYPREQLAPTTVSIRELAAAIEQPLLRAYCCMEMLRPSSGQEVMGLTDNRMAIMEAFDFMKEIAEPHIRKQLETAPKAAAKTNNTPTPTINAAASMFTATQPRTRELDTQRFRKISRQIIRASGCIPYNFTVLSHTQAPHPRINLR